MNEPDENDEEFVLVIDMPALLQALWEAYHRYRPEGCVMNSDILPAPFRPKSTTLH